MAKNDKKCWNDAVESFITLVISMVISLLLKTVGLIKIGAVSSKFCLVPQGEIIFLIPLILLYRSTEQAAYIGCTQETYLLLGTIISRLFKTLGQNFKTFLRPYLRLFKTLYKPCVMRPYSPRHVLRGWRRCPLSFEHVGHLLLLLLN